MQSTRDATASKHETEKFLRNTNGSHDNSETRMNHKLPCADLNYAQPVELRPPTEPQTIAERFDPGETRMNRQGGMGGLRHE